MLNINGEHSDSLSAITSVASTCSRKQLDIPFENIHKESFTVKKQDDNTDPGSINESVRDDSEYIPRDIKIKLYGEEHELNVEAGETVLLTAMREGYDPPFSCQLGACSTCRAKLLSGKVYMDERDALTDEDINEGYILTCQSHPLTDDVSIDYDI